MKDGFRSKAPYNGVSTKDTAAGGPQKPPGAKMKKEKTSMKMKRIAALGVSAMMAASVLTACGGSGSSTPASTPASGSTGGSTEEEITLKVATWDNTSNPSVQNAVDAFMAANPNIKVELMDIPSADYTTKLTTMLNGGADMDAFFVKDADTTKSLADKGQLADLTEYISADGVDLAAYNGLAENFNYDGKQYGLPARTDYYVMFYNKDMFDAKGMEYPSNDWTWADFEEMAKQLTGDGKYGAYIHTWQACVQNWGVQDGEHTIMDYDTGYDFFKPYYEMVLRMQDEGSIQSFGELKSANIHYSGPFAQGTVGMMPMGTWYMATIIEAVKNGESTVNWGVATIPHPEGVEAGWTVGSATPMCINANTDKKDAAWELVKFVTGEEGAAEYAKVGAIPGRADDAAIAEIAAMEGMPEGTAEALKVTNISLDRPIVDKVADVNQMLGEQHSLIMLEQDTIDNVLASMAEQAEAIING